MLMPTQLVTSVSVMHSEWLKARNILATSNTMDETVHGFIGNLQNGMSLLYLDKSSVTSEKDLHTFTESVNYLIQPAARFFVATVDAEASFKDSYDKMNSDQTDLLTSFYETLRSFLALSRQIQPGLLPTGFLKGGSFTSVQQKYHAITGKLKAAISLILADVKLQGETGYF